MVYAYQQIEKSLINIFAAKNNKDQNAIAIWFRPSIIFVTSTCRKNYNPEMFTNPGSQEKIFNSCS
jgi:hypothetical protein